MSNRFHQKYHRRNHHTYTNPANPDAGHDPIASPESPFLGDFVMAGALSAFAPASSYAGYFYSENTGLVGQGNVLGILSCGDLCVLGDLTVSGSINQGVTEGAGNNFIFTCGILCQGNNIVTANVDNNSIKVNDAGKMYVDFTKITSSSSETSTFSSININGRLYNFGSGLNEIVDTEGLNGSFSTISVNVDNDTVKIINNTLQANKYTFTCGVTSNQANCSVYALVDNNTIKINNNNQLTSGYLVGAPNTSIIKDSGGNLKVNVDNDTIKISSINNALYANYLFSSGLCKSTGNTISVKTDNESIGVNIFGSLEGKGNLRLNKPAEVQTVVGPLSANDLRPRVITFNDGTQLSSGLGLRPYVNHLPINKGNSYNCIVGLSDLTFRAWGHNYYFNTPGPESVWPPQQLAFKNFDNFKKSGSVIKSQFGLYFGAVLFSDGSLYVAGYDPNTWKQMGVLTWDSTETWHAQFQQVIFPENAFIIDFDASNDDDDGTVVFAARDNLGQLFTWGFNRTGCTGNGNTSIVTSPIEPSIPEMSGSPAITDLNTWNVGGAGVTMFVRGGRLFAAGYNAYGGLGRGNTTNSSAFLSCKENASTEITNVSKIAKSSSFNVYSAWVIKANGTVWHAGLNNVGQNGQGRVTTIAADYYFTQVPGLANVVDLVTSGYSSNSSVYALTLDGKLYSWGYNGYGQLGLGNTANRSTPQLVTIPNNVKIVKLIQCHTTGEGGVAAVIGENGYVYVAGHYAWGQTFSYSSVQNTFKPLPVRNIVDAQFITNRATVLGMIMLDRSGRVFFVSSYSGYYLGGPTNSYIRYPADITNFVAF